MKERVVKNVTESIKSPDRISLRLDEPISSRFEKVVVASKRTKTSIIEECLERALPELEKHYSKAAS